MLTQLLLNCNTAACFRGFCLDARADCGCSRALRLFILLRINIFDLSDRMDLHFLFRTRIVILIDQYLYLLPFGLIAKFWENRYFRGHTNSLRPQGWVAVFFGVVFLAGGARQGVVPFLWSKWYIAMSTIAVILAPIFLMLQFRILLLIVLLLPQWRPRRGWRFYHILSLIDLWHFMRRYVQELRRRNSIHLLIKRLEFLRNLQLIWYDHLILKLCQRHFMRLCVLYVSSL